MRTLTKLGYVLIGVGIGVIASSIYFKRELDKPIDVEEYVPIEEQDGDRSECEPKDDISISRDTDGQDIGDNKEDSTEFLEEGGRPSYASGMTNKVDTTKIRYSKMYDEVTDALGYKKDIPPMDSDEPEEEDEDDEYEVETGGYMNDLDLPRERVSPYIEIFGDENPQEFVELIYYAGDESLTDDRDQLIPNADEVVGNEALYRLVNGGRGVIDGVIYVRNVKTHINYQIVLDAGSYASTVLGIN